MKEMVVKMLPYIFTAIVLVVVVYLYVRIHKLEKNGEFGKHKKWIDNAPSVASVCGVIFTFLGVTIGLMGFKTGDIEHSIPILLEGLKTAFFTSLVGMFGSLILTRKVNKYLDNEGENISDAMEAANIVVKAVQSIEATYQSTAKSQTEMYENMARFVGSIDTKVSSMEGKMETMNKKMETIVQDVLGLDSRLASIESQKEKHFAEMTKAVKGYQSMVQDGVMSINEQVVRLENLLPKEVKRIQEYMATTNNLLVLKFDEFTELLKKSNTEALVEVMKRVTEEFNKQMSDLINKLVQENFEQLNKSVERLNTWQVENKEMVRELTSKYKTMAEEFNRTSSTLEVVGKDTAALVGNGSKLRVLVEALNKVMIEDEKFIQITQNLTTSAELSKDSVIKFNDEVSSLNMWVRKQRDFVEAVQTLLVKLEDINKINDYSDKFWKTTKAGMDDAVRVIKGSTQLLSSGLDDLDGRFYERLNTTLSNLDDCITAIVKNRRN